MLSFLIISLKYNGVFSSYFYNTALNCNDQIFVCEENSPGISWQSFMRLPGFKIVVRSHLYGFIALLTDGFAPS